VNYIYLLRYSGGCCGDFIAREISKDSNYYNFPPPIDILDNNTYDSTNPFQDMGFTLRHGLSELDTERFNSDLVLIEHIDKKFEQKHLIVPTHHNGNFNQINIPRKKPVRLTSNGLKFFFYGLHYIKRLAVKTSVNNFKLNYEESHTTKQQIYGFEKLAKSYNLANSYDIVNIHFGSYKTQTDEHEDFVNLDIDKLFTNFYTEKHYWKIIFDLSDYLNYNNFMDYHDKNIKLFNEHFGVNYKDFIGNDQAFLPILSTYLKIKCIGAYSED
jgi:hypothetical protein